MIITRTPLRISLGGGGTDLPSYYREGDGGFLVAAAITRHIFIAVNRNFDDDILLKYSQAERVGAVDEIRHPLLRETLRYTDIDSSIEVSSMADIPAGTGLGSSGAFAVGVLKALHAYKREWVPNVEIAREACEIEIERLNEPVGKQDQYIAAVGGVTGFRFHPDESVEVVPLSIDPLVLEQLEEDLLLFFTGLRRSAAAELADQDQKSRTDDGEMRRNLDAVRALGHRTVETLEAGDLDEFGRLLTEQWRMKYERAPTPVHREIDEMVNAGIAAGAAGGKLVGAGGGGFLLFYADDKAALRAAMRAHDLEEVRFRFDFEGSTVIVS